MINDVNRSEGNTEMPPPTHEKIVARDNSLDLLRIVAMGMIISMHYLGHGGVERAGIEHSSYFLLG